MVYTSNNLTVQPSTGTLSITGAGEIIKIKSNSTSKTYACFYITSQNDKTWTSGVNSSDQYYFYSGTTSKVVSYIDSSGYTYGAGYKKNSSDNTYVLLGGGGHKAIRDFATSTHQHYIGTTQTQSSSARQSLTGINNITMYGTLNIWAKTDTSQTSENQDLVITNFGYKSSSDTIKSWKIYSYQGTSETPNGIGYMPIVFGASYPSAGGLHFTGSKAYSGTTYDNYWGININDPLYQLHVGGSIGSTTAFYNNRTSSGGGYYLYGNNTQYGRFYIATIGTANSGDGNATRGAQGEVYLYIGNDIARPAAGTAGGANNSRGRIIIYGTGTGGTTIMDGSWSGNHLTVVTGTNSTAGSTTESIVIVGNSNKKSAAAGSSTGRIRLYGEEANYHDIYPGAPDGNRTHYLPNATGWIATGGNGTSTGVGNTTQPVYLSSSGILTACTPYSSASVSYASTAGSASSAGSVAWSNVTSKPATATRWPAWSEVTSKPSSTGSANQPVYWNGSTFVGCTPYSSASVSYASTAGSASSAGSVAWANVTGKPSTFTPSSHNHDDRYLKLSGGTMTGTINLRSNAYSGPSGTYGMNCNNSDIINVNSIYTADLSDGWDEGILFKRTNGNWDSFRAADGTFYLSCNNGGTSLATFNNDGLWVGGSNGWLRTYGSCGWYSQDYGGGWYMTDSTFIRTYNGKILHMNVNNNSYGASGHHLAADFYNSEHICIGLRNSSCSWYICSHSNTNMYIGYRPNGNVSGYSSDSYPVYITNGGSVYSNSDRKLKKNISFISKSELNDLFDNSDSLFRKFTWKSDNTDSYGFIAQELEEFIPEAVSEDIKGIKHVSYNVAYAKIMASLVNKIKELERRLEEK